LSGGRAELGRNRRGSQGQGWPVFREAAGQTETDEYTRYELLAPETASFKIYMK